MYSRSKRLLRNWLEKNCLQQILLFAKMAHSTLDFVSMMIFSGGGANMAACTSNRSGSSLWRRLTKWRWNMLVEYGGEIFPHL